MNSSIQIFYIGLTSLFVLCSIIEYSLTLNRTNYYNSNDFKSSLKLMFSGLTFDLIVKLFVFSSLLELYNFSIFKLRYHWSIWALCFLLWDFLFYWMHYSEHNIRLFWAIHVNHHSSSYYNLSTALRSGVFKGLYRYFFYIPVILLGFPPIMFFVIYGLGKLWAFFSHSTKLGHWGVLEIIFVTPSHHAVHHSYNKKNLNKNFGETLIIWDKLFGTFRAKKGKLKYGIPENVTSDNFYKLVTHEFQNILRDYKSSANWKGKLISIFKNSDISTQTNDNES